MDESDDELALASHFAGAAGIANGDPKSFKEAMNMPNSDDWHLAMIEKLSAMDSNEIWDLVPLPTGKKAISCGWVYKTKQHADGSVELLKARLVAKGYSQRPGFDFTEVFAPTYRQPTIRMFLAITVVEDLELCTVDISSAFLNGNLEEDIYMKQPPGFETHPGLVCKLKKSLYGLKHGARQCLRGMYLLSKSALSVIITFLVVGL